MVHKDYVTRFNRQNTIQNWEKMYKANMATAQNHASAKFDAIDSKFVAYRQLTVDTTYRYFINKAIGTIEC